MRLALAAAAVSSVLAQAAPGVPPEVGQWLQFGVVGLVVVGFLTGKIRRGADYDALLKKNERFEEGSERVVLTLDRATQAMTASNQLLARLVEDHRRG